MKSQGGSGKKFFFLQQEKKGNLNRPNRMGVVKRVSLERSGA